MKVCRTILARFFIAVVIISSLLVPAAFCQETEDSQVFIAGFNAYQQKDYPSAIGKLNEVLAKYPDTPLRDMALFWLSRSYFKNGNQRDAARVMSQFSKEYPDNPLKATVEEELLNLTARYEKGEKLPVGTLPVTVAADEAARKAKAEQERLAAAKAEQERLAQEKAAQEKAAQEKVAQEKVAQEKVAQEKVAQEKAAQEKAAQEKAAAQEQQRLAAAKAEQDRKAAEQAARAEQERLAARKAAEERQAAEAERRRQEQERIAAEKAAAEAEAARLAAARKEQERLAAEQAEKERQAKQREAEEKARAAKAALRERAIAQYKSIIETYPDSAAAGTAMAKLKELGVAVAMPPKRVAEQKSEEPADNAQVLKLQVAQFAGFEFNLLAKPQAYDVARRISVPFEIVNRGNGPDSFSLESGFPAEFMSGFAPAATPDQPISQTPVMAPGETFKGIVTLTIPAASIDGLRITHPVKAVSRSTGEATQSREVTVIAAAPLLRAVLKTDKSQLLPGEKISYHLAVLNVGSTAAREVTLRLSFPPQFAPVDYEAAGFRQEANAALVLNGIQV
ncbi:MAG TPA: tetratricopeptide repeat protein, partial [Desulfuromonadaceae bacterium]